jgi:HYR domain
MINVASSISTGPSKTKVKIGLSISTILRCSQIKLILTLMTLLLVIIHAEYAIAQCPDFWYHDCCYFSYESCDDARPAYFSPECRAGCRNTGHHCDDLCCFGHALIFDPCPGIIGCPGGVCPCEPLIATGSIPELPNGIDDDCDGYVDDEQCDGVDNDGDGYVDEDPGSCLLRFLFVPLDWQGTQAEFENAVDEQFQVFINLLDLSECPDNFGVERLSVETDNLPAPTCDSNCGVGDVRQSFNDLLDVNINDFDVIAALTDRDICGNTVGCSNTVDFIWLETDYDIVFAHEVGHILGLGDEYCSRDAGSTCGNCNAGSSPPPNFLGSDLGCDPTIDSCCGDCSGNVGGCVDDYKVCCEGNQNSIGGRCVMSYANADNPRAFCDRCLDHLENPPNARSEANREGQAPMDCSFSHLGHERILNLDYSLTKEGQLAVASASLGLGRLGLGTAGTLGRYAIEIRDSLGTLHHRHVFNPIFSPDPKVSGIDYSGSQYEEVSLGLRAVIPTEVSSVKITALKDDVITSQTCLVANGGLPSNGTILLVVDSTQPEITAPDDVTLECASSAGTSVDIGTATASDDCDPSPSVTNDAPALFPLGSTTVTWTATDAAGNESTATQTVSVIDTTNPEITMSVQKVSLWPPNHKMVDVGFSHKVSDICDSNPVVSISVTSDEPTTTIEGAGDRVYSPDAEIINGERVLLRAERSGEGDGRVYVIEVRGEDESGNSSFSSLPVKVDYDKDNPAIDSGQNYDATQLN